MARRISEEARVENYFRTAEETAARTTLRVAQAIVEVRFPKAAAPAKKTGRPTGSKNRTQPPAPPLFEAAG